MTIDEIIKTLETYSQDYIAYKTDATFAQAVVEAIGLINAEMNLASETERADKAEHEKGCDWCNDKNAEWIDGKLYFVRVGYYELGNGMEHYINPAYCPMCGKNLKGGE